MGREVRRVPKDWQHPKVGGKYQPMFDQSFREATEEYLAGKEAWDRGERPDYCPSDYSGTFEDYEGPPPSDPKFYRPDWSDEERIHLMMYETCSEGTPISPAFETPEELAKWLTDNNATAFGYEGASYEAWLRIAKGGWAPSAVASPTGLISGVEALKDTPI